MSVRSSESISSGLESRRRNDDESIDQQPPTKKRTVGCKLLHPPLRVVSHDVASYSSYNPVTRFLDLPDPLLGHCAAFLSAADALLRLSPVSKRLCTLTRHDAAGWKGRVERLQANYQFVTFVDTGLNWLSAYREAWSGLHQRDFLHEHELCYDMTGTVFQFRFKAAAGADWTQQDPWHTHGQARRIVFLHAGNLCQQLLDDGSLVDICDQTVTWRWIARPMDLPRRTENTGHYVRLTIAGRDVPTYSVRRSETGNGGFVMESCWGVYCSFEMTNDVHELVTNDIQWREAFLYNVGSRALPEGEEAAEEFDRAWRG